MKLRQLESILSSVESFREPKVHLEQYPTSAHLAAAMLWHAEEEYGDVDGKVVLDLGTGTGMLGIASCVMGSAQTIGVDIDPDALSIAQENIEDFEVEMDLINLNVFNMVPHFFGDKVIDTIVTNPPFGTRDSGADVKFLEVAIQIASGAVYSLHKTSTRKFLLKKGEEWGIPVEAVAELRFDIPQMYKFHKEKSKDVMVDLLRFDVAAGLKKKGRSGRDDRVRGGGGGGGASKKASRDVEEEEDDEDEEEDEEEEEEEEEEN